MDGIAAIKHLEAALTSLDNAIQLLGLLDGLEDETDALLATRMDLMEQFRELVGIES